MSPAALHPYAAYVKPRLAELLHAVGLDVSFVRGSGDHLFHRLADGTEVGVLDLVGGYGSLLLGHNHPELLAALQEALAAGRTAHAQLSLRQGAGELARRLSDIARRDSGIDEDFVVHFANSGAEAVEVALKHAEYARVQELHALRHTLAWHRAQVQAPIDRGELAFDTAFLRDAPLSGERDFASFEDACAALDRHHEGIWNRPPLFVALARAFHGKLIGSVQATHHAPFRAPFQQLGLQVRFVADGDEAALAQLARETTATAIDLGRDAAGRLAWMPRPVRQVSAVLVEPVQGEGGIHVLSQAFARALRRFCHAQGCPLLADEVQSGMGRTGRFFAASKLGLQADTYMLSKSLGGGLAKIAAVLIRRSLHQRDFALVHSSTFAEDDLSCAVASRVLDILERDEGRVYRLAHEKGEHLRAMLEALQARHPGVIRAVRGEGLLLGVEFEPPESRGSPFWGTLDYTGGLGYFLCSYLFHAHRIRVAPSGSAPRVLRLAPSVGLDEAAMARIENAFATLCALLARRDALPLVFPLCDADRPPPRTQALDFRSMARPVAAPPAAPARKVAFINHLVDARGLAAAEPSLRDCTDAELARFIERVRVDPRVEPYPPVRIASASGAEVDFIVYPLCLTTAQMAAGLAGELASIREAVAERVRTAQQDGCAVAGLGMHTSIVTHNGLALEVPGIQLTTGNALTVAMALEALSRAADLRGLDWPRATAVVVGAAGNIASLHAQMLARRVGRLVLIGSPRAGTPQRLARVRQRILRDCWQALQAAGRHGGADVLPGLAGALARHAAARRALDRAGDAAEPSPEFLAACDELPLVRLGDQLADVALGDLVLCAASHAEPFLGPAHFKPHAVVCDVAVPGNVAAQTASARPDLWVAQGGVVGTPHGESLPPGARTVLQEGQLFACMAETALLGLSDGASGSLGDLCVAQVEDMAALARLHGFRLAAARRTP